MSTISTVMQGIDMDQNGFNWRGQIDAPAWNSWTTSAANPFSFDPGQYQNAPTYNWASWQNGTPRTAYSGQAPTYKRLSDSDYRDLENSLRTSGEISAKEAFNAGQKNLDSTMSNNGMYGSSLMANQANDQLYKNFMNTMATNSANATANRIGMQQQDNQYQAGLDKDVWNTRVNEWQNLNQMNNQENIARNNALFSQNQNFNNYNLSNAQAQNSYNLNRANWNLNASNMQNQLLKAEYDDQWKRAQWNAQERDSLWNRYSGFWNGADPYRDYYQNAAPYNKSSGSSGGGFLSALGSIGGSLLGGIAGGIGSGIGGSIGGMIGGSLENVAG